MPGGLRGRIRNSSINLKTKHTGNRIRDRGPSSSIDTVFMQGKVRKAKSHLFLNFAGDIKDKEGFFL